MIIEYNSKKTLMIHSFQSIFREYVGDSESELLLEDILESPGIFKKSFEEKLNEFDYITFDDGLYQQIEFIKLFPKDKVIFFPSFGLLRPNGIQPNPIENSIAHSNKNTSLSTFMSSTEVWDLVQSGYKIGMHGWYHLNLNLNHHDIDYEFRRKLKILKDDAKKCVEAYLKYVPEYKEIYFCTPYNCLNENQQLYIGFLSHFLEQFNIKPLKLIVFSNERTSIENFVKEIKCHYLKNLD